MLYFIQQDQYIKIGHTKDIKSRLSDLQVSSPVQLKVLGLIDGNFEDESEMQKRFRHLSVKGEWFKNCEELIDFINSLDQDLMWFYGFINQPTNPIGIIKKCRLERNLAMEELGKLMGITKQGIYNMEKREIKGGVTLKALNKALQVMNYKFDIRAKDMSNG